MNIPNPKKGDETAKKLARQIRHTIVAPPGHVLIEADSAAIEAVIVGFAAGDPDYIRLAKAGVHDYLAAHILGNPIDKNLPFDELSRQLYEIKKAHKEIREQAKKVIHGTAYGLTPYGMHDDAPNLFPTQKSAEKMQEFYLNLFPSIRKWQHATLERAHKETYLDNHFGYRHHFFQVLTWDREKEGWKYGDDAKRAIAFVPQSDASAVQTEYLLALANDPCAVLPRVTDPRMREWLRLIIHDAIWLCVPYNELDYAAQTLYDTMTSPIPQFDGLSIGAEVVVGEVGDQMELWHPAVKKPSGSELVGVKEGIA